MAARWVALASLLVAGLVLSGCASVAQPAGKGMSNDGWLLSLFVLVLVLALLAWLFFSGPEKAASQAARGDGHGHEAEHGQAHAAEDHSQVGETELAAHQEIAKQQDAETAAAAPMVIGAPDDLKIVEGIGPKIAGLLNGAGITTFSQLAAADVAHLQQILAGANLSRLADPQTWPEQARLAAVGNWDGLKALQDSLRGGRRG